MEKSDLHRISANPESHKRFKNASIIALALKGVAGIKDIRLFGSVLRGNSHIDSDTDLLVIINEGITLDHKKLLGILKKDKKVNRILLKSDIRFFIEYEQATKDFSSQVKSIYHEAISIYS